MNIYYCWITAALPSYENIIITEMIKRNYVVEPAAKDGYVLFPTSSNSTATLIAIAVYTAKEADALIVHQDLESILINNKMKCYSLIVSQSADSAWTGSNFKVPISDSLPDLNIKNNIN